jgi:hypothetical protein
MGGWQERSGWQARRVPMPRLAPTAQADGRASGESVPPARFHDVHVASLLVAIRPGSGFVPQGRHAEASR